MSTMREVQQNWTEITRRLLERQEYLKFLPFSANLYGLPFSNAALVYHQNPECKRAATAAQWNSIHFVVKRGEHGITVFDETNRNNALSFLFDESQVASSQKTVMPQRMDFSAYEEQLCQAFGQRQGKAYSNLQALCAGMVQHFMSDPRATLLLQENEREIGLHDTQKQQYEESVASVCCYVAMLRCFPEKEIQQPDLSAFDFFRNDIANLIRFGNIVQKIYGNVLKKLEKNVRAIEKNREVEINDKNRTDRFQGSTERTESYHQQPNRIMGASGTDRIGAEIHDAMGHATSRSAQSDGEKHRRTLGQDLAAVDAAESSQSMAAADTGERLPAGNPDDRNRPDRRGDVSEENAAIPTGESSAGQGTEPESLFRVGQESDSGSAAASVGRDRVSDAADTVTTTEKESQAEAENPSVSAFSMSESGQFPLISGTLPPLTNKNLIAGILTHDQFYFKKCAEIASFFAAHEDFAKRIEFLKTAYNTEYSELNVGRTRVGYKTADNGLMIWEGSSYLSRTKETGLTWDIIQNMIAELIEQGKYLTELDLEYIPENKIIETPMLSNPLKLESLQESETAGMQLTLFDESVSMEQAKNQQTAISLTALTSDMIDCILRSGSNKPDCLLHICAEFQKPKTLEQHTAFLQKEYQTDGKGVYYMQTKQENPIQLAAWWDETGIVISSGNTTKTKNAIHISWEQAAQRIAQLLEQGTYVPQEVLDNALPKERHEAADHLLFLYRDVTEKDRFFLPREAYQGNYPESLERLEQQLSQPEQLKFYAEEMTAFAAQYRENHGLLTAQYHDPEALAQALQELQMERITYTAQPNDTFAPAQFITEDEKDALLTHGSRTVDGKFRIQAYFQEEHTAKEKETFLKNEYGIGGSGSFGFQISYDGKGISYEKDSPAGGYASVIMKWNEVRQRLERLIAADEYISQSDIAERIRCAKYDLTHRDADDVNNRNVLENAKQVLDEYGISWEEQPSNFTREMYQTEKASVLKIKNKGSIATIEITASPAIWQRLAEKGLVKQENSADRLIFETDGRNWNKLIIPDKWGNKTNNISIDEILTHEELLIAYHVADEILNEDDMQQPDLLKSADTTAESDRFQLYQLKDGEEYHGIRFESLDQNKLHSNQLNKEDYVLVYEGDLSIYSGDTVEEKLERLYQEFNVNKPVDFMGRSMSVSDVVVIDENAYYCDPIGFREFPEFLREKEVEPPAVADFRAKTEEETLFSKVNLAKFLAERSLSSDEWEDMAYPMFERGYLDTHKPSDKAVFGYHLSESAFFALAQRYHDGEDIRRELAVRLLEGGTSSDIAFVFEGENISNRTYFYAENLRHSLHAERTKNGYQCSFGSTERFVSFEEIGQAFLDRTLEEFNDLMYWRVLDYIKDDIPDISNDTVRELINAFDNAATADWEKGDNLPKLNRIKKALYDILGDEEQTEKAFACIAKQKYNVTFDKPAAKESPVHFGLLGNGITAYDTSRTDPETHDYPIIAQISDEGVVRVYDENISAEDMERINSEAKLAREKFMTNWNMLSPEQQFQRLLDRADISTAINIGREQFSMAQKIEKYMPFVFFGEGERPEPEKKQPAKVSDLAVGDIIMYDGNRREVENISEHSISLKNLDAPDFGGILLGTSDVLAYNGWQQDMESKGFEILSKAEQHSQDTNDILSALSDLDKAKNYINDFSVDEYSSEADFSDLSNVPIAYTTDEKTDLEIQVSADLEKYRLVYAYDGNVVREEQYHSLSGMNANALSVLDYDDLVALSDDEKAKISAVNTESILHTAFSEVRSQFSLTEKQEKFLSRMESFAVRNSVTENLLEQMSQLPVFRQAYGNPRILSKSVFQGRLQRVMDTLETAIQKQISVQSPSEKVSLESTLENQNSLKKEDSSTDDIPEHSKEHQNYRITDDFIGIGTPRERIQANLIAIRTLKEIEQRKTPAATEEKTLLSEYVGWGGLPQIFEPDNHFYNELKELLTDAEYTAARASTNTAFYTPPVVIRSIYQYLEAVGITSGNILEPSCGIGTFLGMRPDSMRNCNFYGVELDSISGRIAQQLYPLDNISITGFEKTNFPDGMFTAAIGNVPFGDFQLFDPKYDKQHFLIHDYFFAKALDQICPGGIVTFITSKGTMDKENSAVRRYLAERAELIGAVRLPNNTFSSAAGTEVTSDILFLRRRTEPMQGQPEWVNLDTNENGIRMNAYFVSHPEMVLGEMQMISGRFGMETACVGNSSEPLSQLLERAVSTLPVTSAPMPIQEQTEVSVVAVDSDSLRNDSFIVHGNTLLYKQIGQAEPFDFASSGLPKRLEKKAEGILRDMIPLRDTVRELIQLQLDGADDSAVTQMQKHLEAVYDNFVGKHGRMTEKDNRAVLELDSSYHLLCSLEIHDDNGEFLRKSDFFTKRTVRQQIQITSADNAQDALVYSLNEKACVDLSYMASLTGKSEDELVSQLTGSIFQNPETGKYEPADEYLSGNVRKKLQIAEEAVKNDPALTVNVEYLQKVQPQWLEASDIFVRLGSTWVSTKYYNQFMQEIFELPDYNKWLKNVQIQYSEYTGEFQVVGKSSQKNNLCVNTIYGTERMGGLHILENLLNSRNTQVFDYYEEDGKKKRILNRKETELAQVKQNQLKEAFANWIWKDMDRREDLVDIYNMELNCIRPREYDGARLQFPGMNPEITLKPHQCNAVARVIYGGNSLLAHTVGAGKTYEIAAAAYELKRLGLAQKNLIVVPNHLTEQWAAEFLRLYPTANLLVATKRTFEKERRKAFYTKAMLGDYDAIIMGHTHFSMIPVTPERERELLERQEEEITAGLAMMERNAENRFSIKQLERTKKQITKKLASIQHQKRDDDTVYFEELGVDRLFLDEAHLFKNLEVFTKMQNVGVSKGSVRAHDLYMKTRYLDEITNRKGCIFATGTPISNSIAECYTFQKYLQHDTLKDRGMLHFDAWAANYLEAVTAAELAPEGGALRLKTRFSKFHNLPELMQIFREIADIQTSDMLRLPVPEAEYQTIVLQPSEYQKAYMESFMQRAENIRSGGVDASVDNMLAITNDGRKLALDQRLLDANLPDSEENKASVCAEKVFQIWKDTAEQKSTQLIFSDLSTPKPDAGENTFHSIYQDIKEKLIAKGIPEKEIAFIHDAGDDNKKKEELFQKVRSGTVRVLIGSTEKMGAGTNVQTRLIALHHMDVPWRPSDVEQREGRMIRQGNENRTVQIFRYVTQDTFDGYSWQIIERKQKIIGQIMTSKSPSRSMEDVDDRALSYAEVKAVCTGDMRLKEQMELDVEVSKLKAAKSSYLNQKYRLENSVRLKIPQEIADTEQRLQRYMADETHLRECTHWNAEEFSPMVIMGRTFTGRKEAGEALLQTVKENCLLNGEKTSIGSYRGFEMLVQYDVWRKNVLVTLKAEGSYPVEISTSSHGNIARIDNQLEKLESLIHSCEHTIEALQNQLETAQKELQKPFGKEEELKEKSARLAELNAALQFEEKNEMIGDAPEQQGRKQDAVGL